MRCWRSAEPSPEAGFPHHAAVKDSGKEPRAEDIALGLQPWDHFTASADNTSQNPPGGAVGGHRSPPRPRCPLACDQAFPKLRGGWSECGEQHLDTLAGQLHSQSSGRRGECSFRGSVFLVERERVPAHDRPHKHDRRRASLAECGQAGAGQFNGGKEVDIHDLLQRLRRRLGEWSDSATACCQQEEVESSEVLLSRFQELLAKEGICLIAGERVQSPGRVARGLPFVLECG